MSYMNDGCDPFGIPYIEYENKKTVKKERDKPIERFTYNGCIIYDNINNERMEVWETVKSLNQLNDENEQLKKELRIYRKVASCSNCHYHNYDWFDDGDEFEVCDKGNDVTEGICEKWEEL